VTPQYVKKIEGKGFPHETGTGDLYVHFNIIFPPKLTAEQKEAIEELFAE